MVIIDEDATATSTCTDSSAELARYADRPLRIGSFSAASNVTGIVCDMRGVSALLHRHGALAFWDFAAAAPYVEIDMRPADRPDHLDAIFLSPHKFIGGPGTPGVLVASGTSSRTACRRVPGGGTVAYVNPSEHVYLTDIEHREEGGTPAIVESIRAGLVFQLKEAVGVDAIRARETSFIRRAIARWRRSRTSRSSATSTPSGSRSSPSWSATASATCTTTSWSRCSTTSSASRRAAAARAPVRTATGCSASTSTRRTSSSAPSCAAARASSPAGCGSTSTTSSRTPSSSTSSRRSTWSPRDGWRLLPDYRFEPASGMWRHGGEPIEPPLSLHDVRYEAGRMTYQAHRHRASEARLADYLAEGRRILAAGSSGPPSQVGVDADETPMDDDAESLRWFPLPHEVLARIG